MLAVTWNHIHAFYMTRVGVGFQRRGWGVAVRQQSGRSHMGDGDIGGYRVIQINVGYRN